MTILLQGQSVLTTIENMELQFESIDLIRQEFSQMASLLPDQIDPAKGSLLISRPEYPDLDETYYLDMLEDMGKRVKSAITHPSDPSDIIGGMNLIIFEEEKFTGNSGNYYDIQNSFLNRVLDRKTGIPVTLSLVYMAVGQRAGLTFHGFGLPGHFITGLLQESGYIFIDPFHNGKILKEKEVLSLNPVLSDSKMILVRILRNLKGIYKYWNRDMMMFQMIEWILALDPNAVTERKERGLIYEQIGNPAQAVIDLERYLEIMPSAEDVGLIREKVHALRNTTIKLH